MKHQPPALSEAVLVSATWVLPVSSEPIRDGAVLVEGAGITAVGTRAELEAIAPQGAEQRHFVGATLMPGLVNAHTHLALTDLNGAVPPMPFAEWLPRLVAEMRPWQIADFATSAAHGAEKLLDAGVTCVADIAYGPAEIDIATQSGLAGVFYTEVLGVPADLLDNELQRSRFPADPAAAGTQRTRLGLSPHSPYTSGPGLLRAVCRRAESLGLPLAIHAAESAAESELIAHGTGPLAPTAGRTADGFAPTGGSSIAYLASLGVLAGATVVHLGEASAADIALLAGAPVRGAIACPRSNRYLHNRVADVPALLAHGIAVGIGTDSAASNDDLDLMAEVRALSAEHPALDARTLLDIATRQGARAVGLGGAFGVLEPGAFADIAVFSVAEDDPERGIVERAGAGNLAALLVGGVWRR
jgi:cytosine/adenosine deaminase-related metal-dependent hydrolase